MLPYAAGTMPVNLSGSNVFAQATGTLTGTNADTFINFSKDNVSPFYDNAGYWIASSSTFVAPALPSVWNVKIDATVSGQSAPSNKVFYQIAVSGSINGVYQIAEAYASNNVKQSVIFENLYLETLEQVKFYFVGSGFNVTNWSLASGATVQWTCLENPSSIGTLDMRTALPADVKQGDLLQDLQKMFNLHIMADAQDPKLLIS